VGQRCSEYFTNPPQLNLQFRGAPTRAALAPRDTNLPARAGIRRMGCGLSRVYLGHGERRVVCFLRVAHASWALRTAAARASHLGREHTNLISVLFHGKHPFRTRPLVKCKLRELW
jgi:hypothetical protein